VTQKYCNNCGNAFNTSNNSKLCYNCTLANVTGGNPPEEGDFNTAKIRSGTITVQERGFLQQDLESVENGTSIREYFTDEEFDDPQGYYDDFEEIEDDKSGDLHYGCTVCDYHGTDYYYYTSEDLDSETNAKDYAMKNIEMNHKSHTVNCAGKIILA